MKKKKLIEKRRKRREAYYNELKKINVLTTDNTENKNENLTKTQLIAKLEELGIEASMKMTKKEILALFPKENERNNPDVDNTENKNESIEEIEIDEIQDSNQEKIAKNTVVEEIEEVEV